MFFSKIIKKRFDAVLGRYEENPACYYFSEKDFPNIKREKYDITGDKGVNLNGAFYYYDEMKTDRLMVFDHGLSAGYRVYFKEIEMLCKHGYTVYTYDHTGCVDSGSDGIHGFAQGVNDLDHVLTALHGDARFANASISLVGHSWGGYSSMNVASLHPEVTHVVSLAGFLSTKVFIEQYLPKFVMKYSKEVMDRERIHNPQYADMDACKTLWQTKAKLMYLQSADDVKVYYNLGMVPLKKALAERENTTFITVENKGHQPQYTEAAAKAVGKMEAELTVLMKKKKLSTKAEQDAFRNAQNWNAMTEQDETIWNKIYAFLDN